MFVGLVPLLALRYANRFEIVLRENNTQVIRDHGVTRLVFVTSCFIEINSLSLNGRKVEIEFVCMNNITVSAIHVKDNVLRSQDFASVTCDRIWTVCLIITSL